MTGKDIQVKQILVVEDNEDMQGMYKGFFKNHKEKYEVDFEAKAEVGLRRIREKSYDLIILDIVMEPMTGDSFFVYVRDDVKTMTLPILVISVLSTDTMESLGKMGYCDFLQKPITENQLMEKINKMIE